MVTVEQVLEALRSNVTLDDTVKGNLEELIIIFTTRYPNVSLVNLYNLLPTLKIEKSNKFVNKRIFKYSIGTNVLEFNIDRMNEDYDMKHILMVALLNIIGNNGVQIGFNVNNKFEALQAGYLEILANHLVGNEAEVSYLEDEIISTNLICTMIDPDILFEAYFTNNASMLTEALVSERVIIMMNEMNYRYNNPGQAISVDKNLAQAFISKERTPEAVAQFKNWASMSKEAKEIEPLLQMVQVVSLEQINQIK